MYSLKSPSSGSLPFPSHNPDRKRVEIISLIILFLLPEEPPGCILKSGSATLTMKIPLDKIGSYPLLDTHYLSDSIIRFKINGHKQFCQELQALEMLFYSRDIGTDYHQAIAAFKYKEKESDWDQLTMELKHLLVADFYYTNGQEVFSLVNESRKWKVGKIRSMEAFGDTRYLLNPLHLSHLTSLDLPAFPVFESAEFYVIAQLQQMKIKSLPLDNGNEITIRELYPEHLVVDFGNHHARIFDTTALDCTHREIEKQTAPHRLKTCLNCRHFQFSGMSHDMSSGSKGYCQLIRNQLMEQCPNDFPHQAVTHIWHLCSSFEARQERSRH